MSKKLNEIIEGSFLRVNEQGKAYWGQSEGGGGGGVQVVTITAISDGSGNYTCTSSHTGLEITEMAQNGMVIANVVGVQEHAILGVYIGSYDNMPTFAVGQISGTVGALIMIGVAPDTTAAGMANLT